MYDSAVSEKNFVIHPSVLPERTVVPPGTTILPVLGSYVLDLYIASTTGTDSAVPAFPKNTTAGARGRVAAQSVYTLVSETRV